MSLDLGKSLERFWYAKTVEGALKDHTFVERYIPLAWGEQRADGFWGWRVFDQREGRFLTDAELFDLDDDDLLRAPKFNA